MRVKIIILIGIALTAMWSCERRPLVSEVVDYALVEVNFDWSLESEIPTGMSFYAIPENGEGIILKLSNEPNFNVRLKEGRYTIIGINYSTNEFDGVLLSHPTNDSPGKLKFSLNKIDKDSISVDNLPVHGFPDVVSAAVIHNFEITPQMVQKRRLSNESGGSSTPDTRITLKPTRLVAELNIDVKVLEEGTLTNGVNYVRAVRCTISGLADAVYLPSRKTSPTPISNIFMLDTRKSSISTISKTMLTFGPTESILPSEIKGGKVTLTLWVMLSDSKYTRLEPMIFDITEQMASLADGRNTINVVVVIEVPKVIVNGGGVTIEDWPDVIDIPV